MWYERSEVATKLVEICLHCVKNELLLQPPRQRSSWGEKENIFSQIYSSLRTQTTLVHTQMNTQRHTHAHVFILISKAEEAASIFISCWSLSQREGERDEIRCQFVCLHLPHCCLQSFTLSCHLHLILSESFKRLSRQSLFLRLSSLYPTLRNSSHPWKTQTCRVSQRNFSLHSLLGVRDNIQS